MAVEDIKLLVPVPRPNKLFLLAGNYAEHIQEGGGVATERAETFPYVFMKPPTTTLTNPGDPVVIPAVSPAAIDWELELAVIIGRRCKGVAEGEALQYVAGYTVANDISNREFHPNPGTAETREGRLLRLAARQVARQLLPVRPVRHVRRRDRGPAGSGHATATERPAAAGFVDRPTDLPGGRRDRVHFELRHARTG